MAECNKSFRELVHIKYDEQVGKLSDAENVFQVGLAVALAAVPGFSGQAGLVDDISRKASEELWGKSTNAINGGVEGLANGASPDVIAAGATGAFAEAALAETLRRIVIQRLGLSAATAVLPFLPEIAIAIGAVAIGLIVAFYTKIVVQATIDYLNQPDQIFEITTAGPLDGTVTFGGETKPIQDGIREGVDVKNVRAGVADHHDGSPVRNSAISADLYGLSSGALYQIYAHCPDVLQLSSLSDTLDTAEVDLRDYDSWRFLDDEFKIDMAGGIDTVYYRTRPGVVSGNNGIFYYDGATHSAGGGFGGGQNILGITSTNAMLNLLVAESLLPDDDLIVKGAENIVLTGENDRFVFTGQDMSVHSGYGKISGGGGGDIIVFNGAKAGPNDNIAGGFAGWEMAA